MLLTIKRFLSALLLLIGGNFACADEFNRTDRRDYEYDLLDPNSVTFLVRPTGRRIGDLAGLCSSLVLVQIREGEEKILDSCVGGSYSKLQDLKSFYLRTLNAARAEGKKILFRSVKTWSFDEYDLKIFEGRTE